MEMNNTINVQVFSSSIGEKSFVNDRKLIKNDRVGTQRCRKRSSQLFFAKRWTAQGGGRQLPSPEIQLHLTVGSRERVEGGDRKKVLVIALA